MLAHDDENLMMHKYYHVAGDRDSSQGRPAPPPDFQHQPLHGYRFCKLVGQAVSQTEAPLYNRNPTPLPSLALLVAFTLAGLQLCYHQDRRHSCLECYHDHDNVGGGGDNVIIVLDVFNVYDYTSA